MGEFENWAFGMVDDNAYQQIQKFIKTNAKKNKILNIIKKKTRKISGINNESNF